MVSPLLEALHWTQAICPGLSVHFSFPTATTLLSGRVSIGAQLTSSKTQPLDPNPQLSVGLIPHTKPSMGRQESSC